MKNTINVKAQTGRSTHGDPTYGPAAPVKCRQENSSKLVKDINGNEVQSNHQISTDMEILKDSLVWLSGEVVATDPGHNIIRVDSATTKAGATTLWHVYL